jgi:hypothetical protein
MDVMEVTTRVGCPVACRYCPQEMLRSAYRRRSGPTLLSREVFQECLDHIPAGVAIHFSGMGEPWSNPDCTEMVLDAHRRGFSLMASTTLTGMTPDDVERLREVPFSVLNIHLPSDGSGGESLRVDRHYLDLLGRLLASGLPVRLRYLGERPHPRLKALLEGRAVQRVTMHTRAGNCRLGDRPDPGRRRGRLACRRRLRQNVLLPNGEVVLCCMDYGLRHVLGSLRRSDYAELFRGAVFSQVLQGLAGGGQDILCRSCDAFAYRANPLSDLYVHSLRPILTKIRDQGRRTGGPR